MQAVTITQITYPELEHSLEKLIEKSFNSQNSNNKTLSPDIKTGDEVCEKLGITIQTLIRWRQKGKVPYLKLGSSIRYDFNKVIEALEVGNKKGDRK